MKNLEQKIKQIEQDIKDLPFKVSQANRFLKASSQLGIVNLIDFKQYIRG